MRNSLLPVACVGLALSNALPALGHGWIYDPPSRQEFCAARKTSFDCGPVKYEPQSVEAPKGSRLCSGGGIFSVLDSGGPWPVTTVGSTVSFAWKNTAPHRTLGWDYYVDGRPFAFVDGHNTQPGFYVTHTLPGVPAGRHTILAVWNIGDTAMAFYNCVDVFVDPGKG